MQKRKWMLATLMSAMMLGLVGCGGPSDTASKSESITISAAASMQGALNTIKADYLKKHNLKENQITINYGGSGTLRQQIEQGAPAAIFISANMNHMNLLVSQGKVTDVRPLATNSLVLLSPAGKTMYTLENLSEAPKIAIGNPDTVPAGKYAKETLTNSHLWEQVQPQLVYGKDVKAVLAYVREGAVSAGFVYKTDAMTIPDKVQVAPVPDNLHQAIVYPMAKVVGHTSPLADDFFQYLQTQEAQDVLKVYGFSPVKEGQ